MPYVLIMFEHNKILLESSPQNSRILVRPSDPPFSGSIQDLLHQRLRKTHTFVRQTQDDLVCPLIIILIIHINTTTNTNK